MGGAAAEVSDATTEILLESAYFEPSGIAKTSKRLGLRSEASARFERGVDPNDVAAGAARAMELLAEVAAAQPIAGAIDVYPEPIEPARITVRTERVNRLLGDRRSPTPTSRDCLAPLGIEIARRRSRPCPRGVPTSSARSTSSRRSRGGSVSTSIARTVPSNPEKIGALTTAQRDRRTIADVLVGAGYDEVYTLPLLAPADLARAGVADR